MMTAGNTFRWVSIFGCVAILFVASTTWAAKLIEIDFNDDEGYPSLVNRGTIAVTGTVVGPVSYSALRPTVNSGGYVGSFDVGSIYGTNYVTFGDLAELDGLWAITICTWIRPTVDRQCRVISKSNTGWEIDMTTAFEMQLALNGSGVVTLGSALTPSVWTFVAVTYDGALTTNNVIYYAGDGTSFTEVTTNTLNKGQIAATAYPLWLGDSPWHGGGTPFRLGQLDNVRIYDEVVDASTLETIMTSDDAAQSGG